MFACLLNSSKANYKISANKESTKLAHTNERQNNSKNNNNINNNINLAQRRLHIFSYNTLNNSDLLRTLAVIKEDLFEGSYSSYIQVNTSPKSEVSRLEIFFHSSVHLRSLFKFNTQITKWRKAATRVIYEGNSENNFRWVINKKGNKKKQFYYKEKIRAHLSYFFTFPLRWTGFEIGSVYVGFVEDKVALG
jgi:hypothetical protein